jgi:hypothetical protein
MNGARCRAGLDGGVRCTIKTSLRKRKTPCTTHGWLRVMTTNALKIVNEENSLSIGNTEFSDAKTVYNTTT